MEHEPSDDDSPSGPDRLRCWVKQPASVRHTKWTQLPQCKNQMCWGCMWLLPLLVGMTRLVKVVTSSSTVAVPVGVAVVSVFGLVFTVSAFAWICCQRKNTKTQKTPPYKFVHMLKGVDIYPESLTGKKKFAASASTATANTSKTDINGNCPTASPMSPTSNGKLGSSPHGSRAALHLDLEKRDLNGNLTTKPFHHHHQKLRSSPDLELPSPHAGFTQPGVMDRRDLPSPSSTLSSLAPTPAMDKPQGDDREGGLGTLHFSLEYQAERKAFIVHIKVP